MQVPVNVHPVHTSGHYKINRRMGLSAIYEVLISTTHTSYDNPLWRSPLQEGVET